MIKSSEFISFIKSKVGCYYWFGTFGQLASNYLYGDRKKVYPSYYTASDYTKQIANPKPCFDCAGLVKSLFVYPKYNPADDLGATGIYGKCKIKGIISDWNKLKNGYLVFKGNDKTKSHVGIYIDGKIYEAKGHAYGVVISDKSDSFKYYAEYYNVDYSDQIEEVKQTTNNNLLFDKSICLYCQGIRLKVNTQNDPLNHRAEPNDHSTIIQKIPKGAFVLYTGRYSGEWYQVQYNNKIGFCHKAYLSKS